ncbi:MAG: hypothetical protein ABFD64_05420 [Armatimonadota bacterium]
MRRYLILTLTLTLVVFLVTSIAPTLINIPGSTAYAQGPFGKKSTGNTNKVEEPKKDNEKQEKKEDKKSQDDTKKDSAANPTEKKNSESREQIKTNERDTKNNEISNSETSTTSNTSSTSSDNRKTSDARPTEKRTTSKDNDSRHKDSDKDILYKRTDERPEIKTQNKKHHSHKGCYPYDPGWVVVSPAPTSYPDSSVPDNTEELTIQQLVDDISYAWIKNAPEMIRTYLPPKKEVKIYKNGKLLCKMKSEDYYAATIDAMNEWQTVDYMLNVVDYRWNKIVARGHHIYKDKGYNPDSINHRSDVYYILRLQKNRWVITDMGFTSVIDVKESEREQVDR